MARKLALIIGNSHYEDACLSRLAAPDVDVRELADVLASPSIGRFDEVVPLLNEGCAAVRRAIARFFDVKSRDELCVPSWVELPKVVTSNTRRPTISAATVTRAGTSR